MQAPRVYSTLTRTLEELEPRRPGRVNIYCCGPTVYDVPHVGHARAALMPDVLVRMLRARGFEVTYVRNITDVDDKILDRARATGEPPLELSKRMADIYCEQMAAELRAQTYAGAPVRVKIDDRDMRGGDKTWQWVKRGVPVRLEVLFVDRGQVTVDPTGQVDAVSDGGDGHLPTGQFRPQAVPHVLGDGAMELADRVAERGGFDGGDGHREGFLRVVRVAAAERHDLAEIDAAFGAIGPEELPHQALVEQVLPSYFACIGQIGIQLLLPQH